MSEINKDVASVSSLKNGTLRHLFTSLTVPEASRKRNFVRRSSSWTLTPKKAAEEVPFEGPPVWPRGSVLLVKENSTRLAELETSSVGSQTSSEVGTRSVGFQSSFLLLTWEPCSNGAPFKGCIGWNYSACSTKLTTSLRKSARRSRCSRASVNG